MARDFETKVVKTYKGFEISKAWYVDDEGRRLKKYPFFYLVADNDDYIGEEYETVEKAKAFIDTFA